MFFRIENYAVEFHDCSQVIVSNNVFYDVGSQLHPYLALDRTHDSEVSYNCHFMSEGRSPAGKPAAGDLWQIDPKLLNVKENDFRPLPGSPLIDAGRELDYVRKDADGNERPFGGTTDIGAYEFVGLIKR